MSIDVVLMKSKPIVEGSKLKLKELCEGFSEKPKMVVLLVGDNPASKVYVEHKKKFCEDVGAECEIRTLEKETSEETFLSTVKEINQDGKVDGFIIQLPLPEQLQHIDTMGLVDPGKDIDGFHFENTQEIYGNVVTEKSLLPCTPKGVLKLFDYYDIELAGKNIVVLGRSLIVGKPLMLLLSNKNATVTLCHSRTKNVKEITRSSDIVIAALGKEEFLDESFFSEGQVVIDVGIHKKSNGKLCGDVKREDAIKKNIKAITPVPGGVGPMTVLCLVENLVIAKKRKKL